MENCISLHSLGYLPHLHLSWPSKMSSHFTWARPKPTHPLSFSNAKWDTLSKSTRFFSFSENARLAGVFRNPNKPLIGGRNLRIQCKGSNSSELPETPTITTPKIPGMGPSVEMDCIGNGLDAESVVPTTAEEANGKPTDAEDEKLLPNSSSFDMPAKQDTGGLLNAIVDTLILISPFFFWGTSMVAMKGVLPKTGPLFVAAVRLIPSGLLLISFGHYSGKKQPSGLMAWLSLALFGLVDAGCFQGFLAEGLERTSAGLGSVIIDSQPLTVAVLAAIFYGESIGTVGAAGLVLGVIGLLLLEVPAFHGNDISETVVSQSEVVQKSISTLWGSGEWWMLLAAQSMAVGTVMVRWVCKYSDPVMATGWHMIIGGLPLLALSVIKHDPAFTGSLQELDYGDWLALTYTSIFGSAISYGVYFYNATRGSLTKLSSLTFLTPMFASIFGYFFLDETFSPIQLLGALVTVIAIYMVNTRNNVQTESD